MAFGLRGFLQHAFGLFHDDRVLLVLCFPRADAHLVLALQQQLQTSRPVSSFVDVLSTPHHLRIGHIHFRVGNVARAEAFYCGALGLDVTC